METRISRHTLVARVIFTTLATRAFEAELTDVVFTGGDILTMRGAAPECVESVAEEQRRPFLKLQANRHWLTHR